MKRLSSFLLCLLFATTALAQTIPSPVTTGVPNIVKGTTTFSGTSYAQGKNFGGLITISTGLPAGTLLTCPCDGTMFLLTNNITSSQQFTFVLFDSNPTSSTITDGQMMTIAAADIPKIAALGASQGGTNIAGANLTNWAMATGNRVAVDASGNLYAAIASSASSAFTFTAGSMIYWRFSRAQ